MKPKPQEKTKKAADHPTERHWREMNRKQRRETMRKIQSEDLSLEVVHPDAGGIDIGNESHYVAVPPSRDSQPVRRFGCTTAELKAMTDWLKQCGIRTIAMQSTSVYWVAVYDILEQAGLEVYLVNARDTKNLPGRKSDVQESQWLMKLHTYGLLRNSFRPSQEVRTMRTCWRQRNDLVRAAARHIHRIQKALTQMNIQLANVLSDVSGMTGLAIIKAILAGERDPHKLAAFRNPRVKASEEQIARSLEGNWQEDLLFVLKQEQDGYEFCEKQMAECDRQLNHYLKQRADRSHGAPLPEEKRKGRLKKKSGNKPQFDLRTGLFRISGNKVIGKGRLPTNNRVTIALKMAASTLRLSDTYLGAQFRRFRTRLGAPVAINAMAAKLARLVYRMLCYGMKYVDKGAALYQAQHRHLQIKQLNRKAASLGYQLIPVPAA